MKNVCCFVFLTLALLCSDVAFAQFGGGPGGFGGGPGGMRPGGGPGGYRPSARDRQQGMTNVLAEDEGRKIGSVNGTVINILDQKPVEYATVSVIDTKTGKVATGGITNFKGAFNIKQIPEGEYTVEHYRIDAEHCNSYSAWCKLGKPETMTQVERETVKKAQNIKTMYPNETIAGNLFTDKSLCPMMQFL